MFTENCRESFRIPAFTRRFLRWFYEKFRLPLVVYVGGLPVKMRLIRSLYCRGACNEQVIYYRTYIGEPITYTDEEFASVTPQQVRDRVRNALQALIEQHQRLPGNVLMALLDRIYTCPRCDKNKYNCTSPHKITSLFSAECSRKVSSRDDDHRPLNTQCLCDRRMKMRTLAARMYRLVLLLR